MQVFFSFHQHTCKRMMYSKNKPCTVHQEHLGPTGFEISSVWRPNSTQSTRRDWNSSKQLLLAVTQDHKAAKLQKELTGSPWSAAVENSLIMLPIFCNCLAMYKFQHRQTTFGGLYVDTSQSHDLVDCFTGS